ncbi:hypothetical protein BS47DRAFT_419812 [Hydnum rufescens UP504]|uniref:Uncharacterized protein n=1 Tax=Hydnum rufescens UP504 TaxID=1448309 RepID=A0A9P6B6N9_9AGAM|nr:hypothetical protein BS47DRAFT_419812 [Hydnum rufescens UP504]
MTESLDRPVPHHLENVTLQPGQTFDCPLLFCHQGNGSVTLSILVVFRESEDASTFYASRAQRVTWVESLLTLNTSILPSISSEFPYAITLEVQNAGARSDVKVTQIGVVSPLWNLAPEGPLYVP